MKTKESLEIFKKRGILLIKDDIGGLDRSVLVSPASEIDYSTVNLFSSFTGGLIYVSFKEER
ncbi:MAG: hypothetical protein KDD56_08110, partial [Bdellovibrionales bacterium]|nr:hypothetical protein [Bdellovibrionales bacterium]